MLAINRKFFPAAMEGADALRKAALDGKRFDYETPIRGLSVLDRDALRIELTEPDLNFLHVLTQQHLAAVARQPLLWAP